MNPVHRIGPPAGRTATARIGTPGQPQRLGAYPQHRLRLVGVPAPTGRPRPTSWPSPPPALSYGVDYCFLRHRGREPVRRPAGTPIVVRLRSAEADPAVVTSVAAVVAEIRTLSGLDIRVGTPGGSEEPPGRARPAEIHVGDQVAGGAGRLRHELGHALGLGHPHRRSLVMYAHPAPDRDWGPGDRLGLRLAGQGPARPDPTPLFSLEEQSCPP